MTTQVEFILTAQNGQIITEALSQIYQLCEQFGSLLVLAEDRILLEQLDDLLWQNINTHFYPWSLDNECYANSVNILLTDTKPRTGRFKAVLNIGAKLDLSNTRYLAISELVENDESKKESARQRYRIYKQSGFDVQHRNLET